MKNHLGFMLAFIMTVLSNAQDVHPKGIFIEDSTKTGFPVHYSLSVTHASSTQVLFPDSSFDYAPFELIKKIPFPTHTINGKSFDSAIYVLRTFELERSQQLALPVFILNEGDTTAIYTEPASVGVKEYLAEIPFTVVFREQTDYIPIKKDFNYPYLIAWVALSLIILFIVFFFFGKTIKRRYRLYTMRIDHNGFLKDFHKMQERFSSHRNISAIEQALSVWKGYLARLEHKPINTFTTTEISNLFEHDELKNGLTIIDRAIYGGLISQDADKAITSLKKFSVRQYHKRKREVQNG